MQVATKLLGHDLCNSVAFAQVPSEESLFVGRLLTPAPTSCTLLAQATANGTRAATLALFRMDWAANTLAVVQAPHLRRTTVEVTDSLTSTSGTPAVTATLVPKLPLTLPHPMFPGAPRPTLSSAYDPSVMAFGGGLWVAFECVTNNVFPVARTAGVSSCVAPFTPEHGVDLDRLSIVVTGTAKDPDPANEIYAAAVPQLFTFDNRIYLYWSAIRSLVTGKQQTWLSIVIRGMELHAARGKDGLLRLWGVGSGDVPVDSHDPALNVVVAGLTPGDPTANTAEDAAGVFVREGRIYLASAIGGSKIADEPCVSPGNDLYGCFRLRIARAAVPLAANAPGRLDLFNRSPLVSPLPPFNPGEYRHIIIDPTARDRRNNLWIIGAYLPEPSSFPYTVSPPLPNEDNILPAGLLRFPIRLDELRFGH